MMSGYSGMPAIHMSKKHLNLNRQGDFLMTGGKK